MFFVLVDLFACLCVSYLVISYVCGNVEIRLSFVAFSTSFVFNLYFLNKAESIVFNLRVSHRVRLVLLSCLLVSSE